MIAIADGIKIGYHSSMILYVDIGNSRIAWLLYNQGSVDGPTQEPSENMDGGKELARGHSGDLTELIADITDITKRLEKITVNIQGDTAQPAKIHYIRVGCVLQDKERRESLLNGIASHWGIEPQLARTLKNHKGLTIAYDDPAKLGVDRWLALLAATQIPSSVSAPLPSAQLIIDVGTATTVDLLVASRHLGGLIIPSKDLMTEAFISRTQLQLSPDSNKQRGTHIKDEKWGTDSESCLYLGVERMFASFMLQLADDFFRDYPAGRLLISGGGGEGLYRFINAEYADIAKKRDLGYDSHLVCRGLNYCF